jgi:KaiC/GvpD/RAD55 family RecA-like ATPase
MSEEEKNKELRERAEATIRRMTEIMSQAKGEEEPFNKPLEVTKNALVDRPTSNDANAKTLTAIRTGTFLDNMFLDKDDKPINGIPFGSNVLLSGLPNSGKSLFIRELILKLANDGNKVCFATAEEIWQSDNARYDLQTRFMETAKLLGLDWDRVKSNLYILDNVKNAMLRDWDTFITAYRSLVETDKVTFLAVDSLSMLEDTRGQIKNRLSELCRYNQRRGVTSVIISQRSTEDADGMNLAGGLALSHIVDIVTELDYKKVSSWDGAIKQDTGAKQGETVYFFRILKCRMCKYDAHYKRYDISKDGLVKVI